LPLKITLERGGEIPYKSSKMGGGVWEGVAKKGAKQDCPSRTGRKNFNPDKRGQKTNQHPVY